MPEQDVLSNQKLIIENQALILANQKAILANQDAIIKNQQTLDLYGERLEAYRDAAYAGDDDAPTVPPDHGSRKSSTAWAQAAFKAKSPSACNTWPVPAKRVT